MKVIKEQWLLEVVCIHCGVTLEIDENDIQCEEVTLPATRGSFIVKNRFYIICMCCNKEIDTAFFGRQVPSKILDAASDRINAER